MKFPCLGFWSWNFQGVVHNFPDSPRVSLFSANSLCLKFLKVKWKIKSFKRGSKKSISTTPPVLIFSGIAQWTSEFHPKSQITILVAWQLELFQKKFQTRERVEDLKLLGVIFIMWKFQRSIKYIKKIAFPRVIKRSWFLALQVPWGVVELSQGWGVNLYFA